MKTPPVHETQPTARRPLIGRAASWAIPLAVFAACLVFDLRASSQAVPDAWRPARVAFLGGVLQAVAFLALAPWWGAKLASESPIGSFFAALRVAAACAGTTLLLCVMMMFEEYGSPLVVLRVEAVALGIGLLAAGVGALLGVIFRSVRGVPAGVTLLGFALAATPFWGATVLRLANSAWKPVAFTFVTYATPISACADAARYDDFFYGRTMYSLLPVSDYPYFAVPHWWSWALLTGAAGIFLLETAAFIRSRRAA